MHQNEHITEAPRGPVKRLPHAPDDNRMVFTRKISPMDLKHVPREKRLTKGSGYGTWREHAVMDDKQLTKIEECSGVHPVDEPHDRHSSEMHCIASRCTTPGATDTLISKFEPRCSKMNAVPPITAPFEAEQEQAALGHWLWKRPVSRPAKEYDSSFSGRCAERN